MVKYKCPFNEQVIIKVKCFIFFSSKFVNDIKKNEKKRTNLKLSSEHLLKID